ncbi:MAG: diacylglycerol kinase family lipid kinase [Candidatus Didemnitutus sp.]|nr:diacylglycerol kinase family lipid kinase [Candidatus Didemnitutus sp.]
MNGGTLLIFNPASGHNRRKPQFRAQLTEFAERNAQQVMLSPTSGPGHATELARAAVDAGFACVAAVGGDGTVNEVARGLIGTEVALGLVPCGSGNGFARHLGIPLQPTRALNLLVSPQKRMARIDTGTANGHPFVNVMGCGFDAELSQRFNQLQRRGLAAYAVATLRAYREATIETYRLTCGNESVELPALLVAVANGSQYGNNARIARHAKIDDGLLDLVAVRPLGFGLPEFAARLFLGRLQPSRFVHGRRGTTFTIERTSAGLFHTDGEWRDAAATIEVDVLPASLAVVLPPQP